MRAMWETAKMSYCSSGCLFMLRWNMMYLQKEYTIRLAVVSHVPQSPVGVGNIVKTVSTPPNDLYTNTMVCFSYKHQWLIVPFTRGIGVLWLQRLEWMSNFKGSLEWSGGDLMVRLGLCLGTSEAVLAFASTLQTDGTNQITALALSVCYDREQQLNRHNILTGINMWMCDR